MDAKLINEIQREFIKNEMPQVRTWMEVEVSQTIKEWGKERTQKFKGLVIKTKWKSPLEKTITVRKTTDWFAIEKIIPVHASTTSKIEVLRQFKVRRSNINFIKKLSGKAARLKEVKK